MEFPSISPRLLFFSHSTFPAHTSSALFHLTVIMNVMLTTLFSLFLALSSLTSVCLAAPAEVYVPPITYPHAKTVWKVG